VKSHLPKFERYKLKFRIYLIFFLCKFRKFRKSIDLESYQLLLAEEQKNVELFDDVVNLKNDLLREQENFQRFVEKLVEKSESRLLVKTDEDSQKIRYVHLEKIWILKKNWFFTVITVETQ